PCYTGEIHDMSEVCLQGAAVLQPVVEIESVAVVVPGIAGICIRAEELETMRKTLIGAQQQTFVSRSTRGLPYIDGSRRTDRLRIILLGSNAWLNHRATNAHEMVQVEWPAQMDKMTVSEIGADDEISGQPLLHTKVEL